MAKHLTPEQVTTPDDFQALKQLLVAKPDVIQAVVKEAADQSYRVAPSIGWNKTEYAANSARERYHDLHAIIDGEEPEHYLYKIRVQNILENYGDEELPDANL